MIAFVKDTMIYIVIAVAIIYIPIKLGGFDEIFKAASDKYTAAGSRRAGPGRGGPMDVRHPRARLRARALHVPALDHGDPVQPQP